MARLVEIDEFIVITSCGHFTMNAFFNQENLAFVGSALFLTHTLTHNRKSASGFSGLFSRGNRHFPSHAARIGLEITLFFLQGDFGTKRPCVQVTSLRPVKAPGNRVFMRFLGVFVFLWFPVLFAADPYRDPYGIWAGGFWPLGLSPFLCSGNSIPLCSICEAGLSGPDTSPEMPHAGVLAVWAGGFPLLPFAVDFGRT